MKAPSTQSVVTINRRAAARLRQGHVWVYRSDLQAADKIPAGSLVSVADERGNLIGSAFYSNASQIALRMLAPGPLAAGESLRQLLCERIHAAIAYRERLVSDSDAYRLVFSEADGLPGLIVDRYADLLAIQVLTQAMDQPQMRHWIVAELREQLSPAAVVERVDARIRELERLELRPTALLHGEKTSTVFTMNGVCFHFDGLAGQKTGAFLDQRENYAAAARHAHGEALDAFCYQGGFALHLARVCPTVMAVDSSRPALEAAERNEELNRASSGRPQVEWMEADAFELLKDYAAIGKRFDTIVLDPPAFAKGQREVAGAVRGYKEINLRALKMLRPGGLLVTCSCSHHVSENDFLEAVRAAASDARRSARILEKRGQAKDHPVLLNVPETAYLKCLLLQL